MKPQIAAALAVALGLGAANAAFAQLPPPAVEQGASQLALVLLPAKGGAKLNVTSPSFKDMADIPFEYTQYRDNIFPGLGWNPGPTGTKSYAVIMQDADGIRNGAPILHWTLFNIPANLARLNVSMVMPPAGANFGPNIRGPAQAYMGPRTPPGPKHRYHLQVFALDTMIPADATYDAALAAMKDHVLASGQVVGLGQADPNAPPPPARGAAAPPAK
jgi:para-nitrobenzyl esterase